MTDGITDQLIEKVQRGSAQMSEPKAIALAGELYSRGQFRQAIKVCRQIISQNPSLADPHNILGVSLNAVGKTKEGIAQINQAIKIAPKIASYHANLGETYRGQGNLTAALAALTKAVRLDPENARAHNNLGIVRYDRKEFTQAIACYNRALELNPSFAEAYNNLGNTLRLLGDVPGALEAYQNALSYREVYPEAYNNLGTMLRELKKPDQAQHAFKKAIAQRPRYTEAYNNLAALYFAENREVDALRELSDVLRFAPRNPGSLILTARIQLKRSNFQAAEQACRMVLEDDATNCEAMVVLGQLMHETDRYDEAITLLEKVTQLEPGNAVARNYYGVALKSVGRLDEARKQILKALEINDKVYGAYSNLNDLVDFSKEPQLFGQIERIMTTSEELSEDQLLPLHFAYAKALDDVGQHEKALEHFIAGGKLKRARLRYVETETFSFFDKIKQAFPKEIFEDRPYDGIMDDRPVFILGMPRSGSTLVEQIISSHPDVYGAGEVKYFSRALNGLRDRFPSLSRFPEMTREMSVEQWNILGKKYLIDVLASSGEAKKITDKLLTNYFFVGLIHILYPNAKIINTRRNPVDTCLSAFTKLFKDDMPHSYDLGEIGRYYLQYESLMDHWKQVLPAGVLTTVVYEDVVKDTEAEARRLIDFIGLPWDDRCVEFHKSSRPVKTASVAQVRKPIYTTSVSRWEKYGDKIQPLLDALHVKRSS
ncbi:tetratricopeptide repeat protein [Altererythrobacter sp. KTW20L]|uniref:tetratricopeptide repeat-containing sulfotransferase family protein n=1 Tax=Altererythrobacter sp. KTW20L TaxID=2942210 RepID=UPI0020C09787|nr:tetratricopeptide repeat-containing sulfotransferase family protein [Altererythrobacter sp. KTW20L]MCL6251541.1 tetratricopeptide repeat protein [Altererythrobacter sp. KTW20L]